MKILSLSLNKLELAHFQLRKPLIIVGRAPTCDVVLRAPGIKPIHFIVEWIGNGKFDARTSGGMWSIVDVSKNAEAGEGLVLGDKPIVVDTISFVLVESNLESSEVIGGRIVDNLTTGNADAPDLLEFVQVRNDSGAIEEVRHVLIPKKNKKPESLSKEFKEFKIERNDMPTDALLNVLLQELPGAEIFMAGRKVDPKASVALGPNDFLQVKWNGRDFYLRFVEEVKSPPIPVDFWGDPLLKWLTVGAAALLLLFLLLKPDPSKNLPEVTPPVRVARIEVAPPPPPPVVEPEVKPQVEESKVEKSEAIVEKKKAETTPAKAGASRVTSAPQNKPKAGLNVKAPVADVNRIGILGALNKNVNKGAGVRADQVINNGIVQEAVTGKDDAKIVISNPPAGVIGSGRGGAPNGKASESLGSASTTLAGVKNTAPDSKSLIARSGGTGNSGLGATSSGIGTVSEGTGTSTKIGDSAGDFSVSGGLDRDTVRRIIQSYRAQVRACYDRALVSNPNLQGRISYSWKILSDGGVADAKVAKTNVDSANLKACVLEVIQQMQFPKSSRAMSTTVIYPFVFQGMK